MKLTENTIKYVLLFWAACVIAGAILAVGLAHAGMDVQDAFNSGMVLAFLPVIVVVALAALFIFLG